MAASKHEDEARRVIQHAQQELGSLAARIGEDFSEAVELLAASTANNHKTIIVGIGKSGNIARKLVATLSSTGSPAVFLNAQDALHGDLGVVADGDPVIALSDSGETEELLALLPHLQRTGTPIISFTGNPESTLAQESRISLDTGVSEEACPLNLAPTTSATNMLVLGDALCIALLTARGFRSEDFAKLHPGGSLGRNLLTRVGNIMRKDEQFACVLPTATVGEAIAEMGFRRCGAAVVADVEGHPQGIFTHGDFARAFGQEPELKDRPVADFMSTTPITVAEDALAASAVAILAEHRIDDLLVLNEEGKVCGLIDSQDLSRLKIC